MTKIEWTDEVWNPVTGCDKVSQGCKNCYAEIMHRRLMGMFPEKYSKPFLGNIQLHIDELMKPTTWKKPRRVFVNSMSDLFHPDVPFSFIYKVFAVMDVCREHTFQILTKRPERMLEFILAHTLYLTGKEWTDDPLENVWLGVSVEDQTTAADRIPLLLDIPAAIRFISCEPLLGKIDLDEIIFRYVQNKAKTDKHLRNQFHCGELSFRKGYPYRRFIGVDWVIVGGESGRNARPMHPDWARSLCHQSQSNSIPFFFKQWGEYIPMHDMQGDYDITKCRHVGTFKQSQLMYKIGKARSGNMLDGKYYHEFPLTSKTNINQQPL